MVLFGCWVGQIQALGLKWLILWNLDGEWGMGMPSLGESSSDLRAGYSRCRFPGSVMASQVIPYIEQVFSRCVGLTNFDSTSSRLFHWKTKRFFEVYGLDSDGPLCQIIQERSESLTHDVIFHSMWWKELFSFYFWHILVLAQFAFKAVLTIVTTIFPTRQQLLRLLRLFCPTRPLHPPAFVFITNRVGLWASC